MYQITGTVLRSYTADKFGKLTLEVKGDGKYPDRLDFKSFSSPVINTLRQIGNGETVTVDFVLQTEKVKLQDGTELTETGKNGTAYPVKVPFLKMTGIATVGADSADKGNIPF